MVVDVVVVAVAANDAAAVVVVFGVNSAATVAAAMATPTGALPPTDPTVCNEENRRGVSCLRATGVGQSVDGSTMGQARFGALCLYDLPAAVVADVVNG